ncbi:adenylyl-sulfate kinase [Candidatus Latescibacterota bacterium]
MLEKAGTIVVWGRMSTAPKQEQTAHPTDREHLLGQQGCVVWLTGLSGSGKTTIARGLERKLLADGHLCYILDGDVIRRGLNGDLGFSPEDRAENIRRIGHVAALFADAGVIAVTAFISPYRADRRQARACVPPRRFIEVYLNTPLEVCEQRDRKGLYEKARAGEIPSFTGVSAPYEPPEEPELTLDTAQSGPSACIGEIVQFLTRHGLLQPPASQEDDEP